MQTFLSTTTARRARLHRPALLALLGLAAVVASLLPSASQAGAAEAGNIQLAGKLERIPADALEIFGNIIVPSSWTTAPHLRSDEDSRTAGTVLMLPEVRQLWQIWVHYTPGRLARHTAVAVRDIDSLKIVRTFVIPLPLTRAASVGGEWMHAVDPGKRVFLFSANIPGIIEIDLRTFERKQYPFGSTIPTGAKLGGVTYDPHENALIGLVGAPASFNVANTNTLIFKRNLTTGTQTTERTVRSCTGPLPSTDQSQTYGMPVFPAKDFLYLACHRAGQVGAVVRLPRQTAYTNGSAEEVTVGPVYLETAMSDPPSGRLFLATVKGEVWVFDTATMSFVGVVAAHADSPSTVSVGYGLDPVTGRLFFQSGSYGVGIAEGRFFPIPQAVTEPKAKDVGQDRIYSDAQTGKFFVLPGGSFPKSSTYNIYVAPKAPVPPARPDPDRSTVDRAEEQGVTQARYFASGSGYGTRALMANGISTLAPAPTVGVVAPTAQIIADHVNPKCGFTDREMVAGRVAKSEYDSGSTAANSIAFDVDERTKLDLSRPSRCDVNIRNGSEVFKGIFATAPLGSVDQGPGWTRTAAACTSSEGGQPADKTGDNQGLGTSNVKCPVPGGKLTAFAEARMDGEVKVGRAWTTSTIERTSKGVQSVVTAVAQDINIAGQVRIEEVRSEATSAANGRPVRGPMSTYKTVVKGVAVGPTQLCGSTCDLVQVLEALNQAVAGRVQFRSGSGLDETLREGTPKGALTAAQKSTERQASDQALVGDFTTEVPGLEMIVYNDNSEWGRARQIYQFAGVSSVAGYSIVMLPAGAGFDPFSDGEGGLTEALTDGGLLSNGSSFGTLGGDATGGDPTALPLTTVSDSDSRPGFLRALGRGIRMFFTNPRQALLLLTAWGLLSLPAMLSRRRRLLAAARSSS